ncbi:MAG TPA: hypothetical protein VFS92_05025, partial [Planctomycetota bacterium]|nr:hypothetical protein [Planctomycetota bacterium]
MARQLVSDVDSGFFATFEAIRIGERIVPAIFKASEDFKKTHSRNLGWCAELFCVVKSKDSVESFRALTRREKRLVRLLGLIGLASNGALENPKETEEEWIRLLAGR